MRLRLEDARAHNGEVYRAIASHFAKTRDAPWPEVVSFVDEVVGGPRGEGVEYDLLDLGCGNGRHGLYAVEARGARVAGVDNSGELLDEARRRASSLDGPGMFTAFRGELDDIPLDDRSASAAVCIASLHHLPTVEERRACLEELVRVLGPGGTGLVSVWSIGSPRFAGVRARQDAEGPDVEGGVPGDTLIPWTRQGDGAVFHRYYHLFKEDELAAEAREVLGASSRVWTSGENIYCRFERG